jgi:hypothetical protein
MAVKSKLSDKALKAFIKRGGRAGAKADFNKILSKAIKNIDTKR